MAYEHIGEAASQVWNYLGKKGRASVSGLPRALKLKSAVTYQSLGWLAREGKVQFENTDGKECVCLTPEENEAFASLHRP